MEPPRAERNSAPLPEEGYNRGVRRSLAAWEFLCAFPGMPSVYYGDDAGCQGMGDPFCRGTYPWDHINEEIHAAYVSAIARRNANDVLRNGYYRLTAIDPDVILLERFYLNGQDAFGAPATGEPIRLALNRSIHPRRITVSGNDYILDGESSQLLR